MGCNCGGKRRSTGTFFNPYTFGNDPDVGPGGIYLLSGDPEDSVAYHGSFPAAFVRYVGYGTEWEKLFRRDEHGLSSAYAIEHHVAARVLPAVQFPHDRITAIFGS